MNEPTTAAPVRKRRRGFTFDRLTSVMNSIGTVWVFVLLVIINADIVGRAVFNHPIRGVPEIVSMSIVALVFIQIAHTIHAGRLTRSEVLLNMLARKLPRLGSFLQGTYHLVGACLFVILLGSSVPLFTKAWQIDEYVGAEGDFKAPLWPVRLIVLIGCATGAMQFLIFAVSDYRRTIFGNPGLTP